MYASGEGPLDGMIESLFADAEMPPKEVKGVSQEFLDGECDPRRQDGWGLVKELCELV